MNVRSAAARLSVRMNADTEPAERPLPDLAAGRRRDAQRRRLTVAGLRLLLGVVFLGTWELTTRLGRIGAFVWSGAPAIAGKLWSCNTPDTHQGPLWDRRLTGDRRWRRGGRCGGGRAGWRDAGPRRADLCGEEQLRHRRRVRRHHVAGCHGAGGRGVDHSAREPLDQVAAASRHRGKDLKEERRMRRRFQRLFTATSLLTILPPRGRTPPTTGGSQHTSSLKIMVGGLNKPLYLPTILA